MHPYQIIIDILDKPDAPKCYRTLKEYFKDCNMHQEASAIDFLIEKKFDKNNHDTTNDSLDNSK